MEAVRVVGFVVAWVLVVGVLLGRNPGDPLRRREFRAGAALSPTATWSSRRRVGLRRGRRPPPPLAAAS